MPHFKKGHLRGETIVYTVYCRDTSENNDFPALEYCELLQHGVDNFQRLSIFSLLLLQHASISCYCICGHDRVYCPYSKE